MVQGGDPTGTGRGGESIYGYAHDYVSLLISSSTQLMTMLKFSDSARSVCQVCILMYSSVHHLDLLGYLQIEV